MATATKTQVKAQAARKTKIEDKDNRKKISELLNTIESSWFELSVVLSDVYRNEEFKSWGFPTFREYIESGEVGIEYRIAMWRVQMGDAIKQFSITKEQVETLGGWTKFKEISGMLKKDMEKAEVDSIISQCKGKTFEEIKNFAQQTRNSKATTAVRTTMSFRFLNEQAAVINEALKTAMSLIGLESEDTALEYIAIEWLSNHNPEKAKAMQTAMETRITDAKKAEEEETERRRAKDEAVRAKVRERAAQREARAAEKKRAKSTVKKSEKKNTGVKPEKKKTAPKKAAPVKKKSAPARKKAATTKKKS